MKTFFTIGETAKAAHTTIETLRHYDRIGLVTPSKKQDVTNYRYYTQQDIVRINTIRALQQMDLPLQKIKEVLEYDDLEKIVSFLEETEKKADEKIAALAYSKTKIKLAISDYKNKICQQHPAMDLIIKYFPRRVILLADTVETPTLDTLWSYLHHFYDKLTPSQKEQFEFEDLAGIYSENGISRLFAVCIRYTDLAELKVLPEGRYLCADCTEKTRTAKLNQLLQIATLEHNVQTKFSVQQILISGILQWTYEVQLYLG